MLSGLLGRKVGMTQIFGPNGTVMPVTVIEAGPCVVTQVKTVGTDGYEAVQLGFGEATSKHVTRPVLGHLGHALEPTEGQRKKAQQEQAKSRQEARNRQAKAAAAEGAEGAATETEADQAEASGKAGQGTPGGKSATANLRRRRGSGKALGPFKVLREVHVVGEFPELGEQVTVGMFSAGEEVDLIGTSKGKGFAGVMKRHGFGGGPRTHGQSDRSRAPGSIGPGTTPGRVYKGTRMAGRMGGERVTVQALRVVEANPENNLLLVYGSVPGPNGGLVMIRKSAAAMAAASRRS